MSSFKCPSPIYPLLSLHYLYSYTFGLLHTFVTAVLIRVPSVARKESLSSEGRCRGVRHGNKDRRTHLRTMWEVVSRMTSRFLSLVSSKFKIIPCTKTHCSRGNMGERGVIWFKLNKFQDKCFLLDSSSRFVNSYILGSSLFSQYLSSYHMMFDFLTPIFILSISSVLSKG